MNCFTNLLNSLLFCLATTSLSANNIPGACAPLADSLELVSFYQNYDGGNWSDNTNWLVAGMPINTWHGISVNSEGCVSSISLNNNQLTGTLYDINLPELDTLSIGRNTISLKVCDQQLDSLELVKLYQSAGGPAWTNQSNWLVPGMPINTWHGVSANTFGCVEKLDLTDNNLVGTIPILKLNTLDTLILENNLLEAAIPELETPFICRINFKKNKLVGGFPAVLGTWFDLQGLDLSNNELSGPIPPILGDLCDIEALQLNNNQIIGELPEALTLLVNLQAGQVDFSNNLIDSLKDKIIWFCPFGDTILEINPSNYGGDLCLWGIPISGRCTNS